MSQNFAHFVGQFGIQNTIILDSLKFSVPLARSQFYVEMWPALRKGSGWSYSQGTLNSIGTRGGKKIYDNGDYDDDDDDDDYDDDDDDDDDYNVFLFIPKDLKQGWHHV